MWLLAKIHWEGRTRTCNPRANVSSTFETYLGIRELTVSAALHLPRQCRTAPQALVTFSNGWSPIPGSNR